MPPDRRRARRALVWATSTGTWPQRASSERAAAAIWAASTPKNRRSAARESLRPKPSVPRLHHEPPGIQREIMSGHARIQSLTAMIGPRPAASPSSWLTSGTRGACTGVEQVPAVDLQRLVAQQLVRRGAPDLGGDAVRSARTVCASSAWCMIEPPDRMVARGAPRGSSGAARKRYRPRTMSSSVTPSGRAGIT